MSEADYENTPGKETDGQFEDAVNEQQDEDYVNPERINDQDQDQYDDIDNPPRNHIESHSKGNGLFFSPRVYS